MDGALGRERYDIVAKNMFTLQQSVDHVTKSYQRFEYHVFSGI